MATVRKRLAVCIRNDGYEASLERRKIYQVIPDSSASRNELIRVVDESGEDYLYPESYFAPITLPQQLRKAVLAAA